MQTFRFHCIHPLTLLTVSRIARAKCMRTQITRKILFEENTLSNNRFTHRTTE